MEKKRNLWVTPTDKPSRLWTNNLRRRLELDEFPEQHLNQIAKHIYITSDEEIKESDWFYNTISLKPEPFKACENGDGYVNCSKYSHYRIDCKKIILSTDQDLIKDGVQAIDDTFLEWFVQNTSCEEVETYSLGETNQLTGESGHYKYEIIIPSEENSIEAKQRAKNYMSLKGALEPKQETLEEAAEKEYPIKIESIMEGYHDVNSYQRNAFIKGAKLAQETMYSEEDMEEAFTNGLNRSFDSDFDRWFEQFKKK